MIIDCRECWGEGEINTSTTFVSHRVCEVCHGACQVKVCDYCEFMIEFCICE